MIDRLETCDPDALMAKVNELVDVVNILSKKAEVESRYAVRQLLKSIAEEPRLMTIDDMRKSMRESAGPQAEEIEQALDAILDMGFIQADGHGYPNLTDAGWKELGG